MKKPQFIQAKGSPIDFLVKNVFFYYTKNTGHGAVCYQKEALLDSERPWMQRQYETQIMIDKATFKAIKAKHKKAACKEIEAADFKDIYGVEAPYEADEYYMMTIARKAFFPDGKENRAPQFVSVKREDLKEVGIGNGSFGHVKIRIKEQTKGQWAGTTSLYLEVAQIVDLVAYEVADTLDDFDFEDEFETDEFENDDIEMDAPTAPKNENDDWE